MLVCFFFSFSGLVFFYLISGSLSGLLLGFFFNEGFHKQLMRALLLSADSSCAVTAFA